MTRAILVVEVAMTSDYVEQRNVEYYVAGTRISLDSVVSSFERGNCPEAIQKELPLLRLPQIYGAIAFYLDHQAEVRQYLENEERGIHESIVPLSEANPELRSRLQRARGNGQVQTARPAYGTTRSLQSGLSRNRGGRGVAVEALR